MKVYSEGSGIQGNFEEPIEYQNIMENKFNFFSFCIYLKHFILFGSAMTVNTKKWWER